MINLSRVLVKKWTFNFPDRDLNQGPSDCQADALPSDDVLSLDRIEALEIYLKAVDSNPYSSFFSQEQTRWRNNLNSTKPNVTVHGEPSVKSHIANSC